MNRSYRNLKSVLNSQTILKQTHSTRQTHVSKKCENDNYVDISMRDQQTCIIAIFICVLQIATVAFFLSLTLRNLRYTRRLQP